MQMKKDMWQYVMVAVLMLVQGVAMVGIIPPGAAQAANFGGPTDNGTANYMTANWMGIGTTTPTKILHVTGTGPGTVPLFQRASDSAGFIIERTPTNRWVLGVNESPTLGNGFVLSTIPTGTTSIPRLLVMQDGRVGINTVSPDAGAKLHVVNDNTTSGARAIFGESNSGSTFGVYGKNSANDDYGYLGGHGVGVGGEGQDMGVTGSSTSGIGVQGASNSGTGVWGDSVDVTGVGVYGRNTGSNNYGRLGDASYGAYGHHAIGTYGFLGGGNVGVYGYSPLYGQYGSPGNGVYGESDSFGVHGYSHSGRAIYGYTMDGYAGFFDGYVYVTDNLTTSNNLTVGQKAGIGTSSPPTSVLQVAGPVATAYRLVSVSYTVADNDSIVAVDASGGTRTITLPTAVGITGRLYTLKKVDSSANQVTVDGNGSQTIDGVANDNLTARWKYVSIVSDGANWLVTANN